MYHRALNIWISGRAYPIRKNHGNRGSTQGLYPVLGAVTAEFLLTTGCCGLPATQWVKFCRSQPAPLIEMLRNIRLIKCAVETRQPEEEKDAAPSFIEN